MRDLIERLDRVGQAGSQRVLTEAGDAAPIHEDGSPAGALQAPPVLEECVMMGMPGEYRSRTFDEKLRDACGMLRMALMDEAYSGLDDGGKTLKPSKPGERDAWQAVEAVLKRAINPDKFKSIVGDAKAELDKHLE